MHNVYDNCVTHTHNLENDDVQIPTRPTGVPLKGLLRETEQRKEIKVFFSRDPQELSSQGSSRMKSYEHEGGLLRALLPAVSLSLTRN